MQPDRGSFKNDPGYEHRVIWIDFPQGQDGNPKYWARVDLTEDACWTRAVTASIGERKDSGWHALQ